MPKAQGNNSESQTNSNQTDRFLIKIKTLELANKLRNGILHDIKPRVWVYVISEHKNKNIKGNYNLSVSNEFGGHISEHMYEIAKEYAEKFLEDNPEAITPKKTTSN